MWPHRGCGRFRTPFPERPRNSRGGARWPAPARDLPEACQGQRVVAQSTRRSPWVPPPVEILPLGKGKQKEGENHSPTPAALRPLSVSKKGLVRRPTPQGIGALRGEQAEAELPDAGQRAAPTPGARVQGEERAEGVRAPGQRP